MRWRRLCLLLAVVAGCPAPGLYSVELRGEPCERAARLAYRSMTELGYEVTSVVAATPERGGKVEGTKTAPDGSRRTASVRISCDAEGVRMQPVEGALVPSDYDFSRSFGYSVQTLAKLPDTSAPTEAQGLEVLLEHVDEPRARLDLGGPALAAPAVLLRVTVRNHTERAVVVDRDRVLLTSAGGGLASALPRPAEEAALAAGAAGAAVRRGLLGRETVAPGDTIQRYLVFPSGDYADGQVAIEDPETGESDGFVVPVQ